MTDQEKKSGASSAGSSLVMVEQTTGSRHKTYRPTELQDEAPIELHHKRSRAPAVPSVAEESSGNPTIKERKERDHAAAEKQSLIVSAKVPSKRSSSPEAIVMLPVDIKRAEVISQPSQPIPAPVGPSVTTKTIDKTSPKEDESVTEEIAELRTSESRNWDTENGSPKNVAEIEETEDTVPVQRILASEDNETENMKDLGPQDPVVQEPEEKIPLQITSPSRTDHESAASSPRLKKKVISWTHSSYLDKVQLQNYHSRSLAWVLDRKASVGPCFKKTMPYGQPSGITISLPKKSQKSLNEIIKPNKPGGISITVSKKCLNSNLKLSSDFELGKGLDRIVFPRKENRLGIKIEEGNCAHIMDNLKGKLENWRGKIKHVLHM